MIGYEYHPQVLKVEFGLAFLVTFGTLTSPPRLERLLLTGFCESAFSGDSVRHWKCTPAEVCKNYHRNL